MHYDRLELPTEQLVTAQQVITGIALLEIGALSDLESAAKVLEFVMALKSIM